MRGWLKQLIGLWAAKRNRARAIQENYRIFDRNQAALERGEWV